MSEYFLLMHPDGMGQSWSDVDVMPEWERREFLYLYEEWKEAQENDQGGGGTPKGGRPRFTRGG